MFGAKIGVLVVALLTAGPTTDDGSKQSDELQRLERRARTLARARGCRRIEQCACAPLGHSPCGGPREYVVYCRTATNERALKARLERLERLEREQRHGAPAPSTCEVQRPPLLELVGGACRVVQVGPSAVGQRDGAGPGRLRAGRASRVGRHRK